LPGPPKACWWIAFMTAISLRAGPGGRTQPAGAWSRRPWRPAQETMAARGRPAGPRGVVADRAAGGHLKSGDVAAAPVRQLRADHHPGPGIECQQQLRHIRAGSQPPVIGLDPGHHVLRRASSGRNTWPGRESCGRRRRAGRRGGRASRSWGPVGQLRSATRRSP
jgi:hypothetical protein